jgi:DNA-binding CsgD family transcriptional regulator
VSVLQTAASVVNLAELLPRPTPDQVRRNLRFGIAVRWITVAVIAAGGMLTPQLAGVLLYLMAAASIYTGAIMVVVARSPAGWDRRIALAVTIIDHLFCFTFLGIYASHVAGSQALAGYSMGTIEAVFFFGAPGAILSLAMFVASALLAHGFGIPLFGHSFDGAGIVNSVLTLGMVAVCLVGVMRIRLVAGEAVTPRPVTALSVVDLPVGEPVRLSRREREVLTLVAEGYSNTMIATHLRLSDSTVKGYVENLLLHLNARNRAEAVAAASRLKLL